MQNVTNPVTFPSFLLYVEYPCFLYSMTYYDSDKIRKEEKGGVCSRHNGDIKCKQNFFRIISSDKTTCDVGLDWRILLKCDMSLWSGCVMISTNGGLL